MDRDTLVGALEGVAKALRKYCHDADDDIEVRPSRHGRSFQGGKEVVVVDVADLLEVVTQVGGISERVEKLREKAAALKKVREKLQAENATLRARVAALKKEEPENADGSDD